MTLRTDAVSAYTAGQNTKATEARTALGLVLTPFVVTPMTVADTVVTEAFTLIVFTDGDVRLGVRNMAGSLTWTVSLVNGVVGEWTELSLVTSLAQLGKVVGLSPQPYLAWVIGVVTAVNAFVTYGGFTWKCMKATTTKVGEEPPNAPTIWVKVLP